MIRLLLVALGGWAVWRYRNEIKAQLPHIQKRAVKVLGQATEKIKEGLQLDPETAGSSRSRSSERQRQAKR